ncbi:MAG: hypothetical protein ACP5OJ_01460 [Methanothermobacter sp.]
MSEMALFILKIVLTFFLVYSLVKSYVFFFVKYETRRKLLDSSYKDKTSALKIHDSFLLFVIKDYMGF